MRIDFADQPSACFAAYAGGSLRAESGTACLDLVHDKRDLLVRDAAGSCLVRQLDASVALQSDCDRTNPRAQWYLTTRKEFINMEDGRCLTRNGHDASVGVSNCPDPTTRAPTQGVTVRLDGFAEPMHVPSSTSVREGCSGNMRRTQCDAVPLLPLISAVILAACAASMLFGAVTARRAKTHAKIE